MDLEVWMDGTSRPKLLSKKARKKGHSFVAVVIKNKNGKICELSKYVGILDNNQAEYEAFILALEEIKKLKFDTVSFYTDSDNLQKQVNGIYTLRKQTLKPYLARVQILLDNMENWELKWVPRKLNSETNALANKAIKEWAKGI